MPTCTVRTYAQADAWLGDKDERTAYLKATRLHRCSPNSIAVRYHDTDVVTYHADGWYTLRTGGWYTNTTQSRMDAFTPFRMMRRGRWWVAPFHRLAEPNQWSPGGYEIPDWDRKFAYAEEMRLRPTGDDVEIVGALDPDVVAAEDRQNAYARRQLNAGMKIWNAQGCYTTTGEACPSCLLLAKGIGVASRQHFIEHLAQLKDSWLPRDVVAAAHKAAGQKYDLYPYVNERWVRSYLLAGLYVGACSPSPNGRKPLTAAITNWRYAA